MYATSGLSAILGLEPGEIIGKSFYYCIQENCLPDAIKCLESAKANDSIAYLRFWYRDPLQQRSRAHSEALPEDGSDEDEEGGVALGGGGRSDSSISMTDASTPRPAEALDQVTRPQDAGQVAPQPRPSEPHPARVVNGEVHRTTSDNSTYTEGNDPDTVFDRPDSNRRESSQTPPEDLEPEALEIEAVVSCSSDGLVVILRKARPLVPQGLGATESPYYANGLFASPWAPEPVMPPTMEQSTVAPFASFPTVAATDNVDTGFMAAIRDVAVFAWSLTGINGSLAQYARGHAGAEALPPDGLPIWDPNAEVDERTNDLYNGFLGSAHRPFGGMGEPGTLRKDEESGSSEDEVVWKRTPTMPPWRRPKRRAHDDAFGGDEHDGVDGATEDGGRKRAIRLHAGSATGSSTSSASGPGSGSGSGSAEGSGAGSATGYFS